MPKDGQQLSRVGRVAVVVPSYNHAPFVAAALRSVLAQTHAPARLLVIDDGSRDGSPRVIEDVLKDCPFPCELIARENRSTGRATVTATRARCCSKRPTRR
jgi:glycosyltransferase involved in cell wall biosynthesis